MSQERLLRLPWELTAADIGFRIKFHVTFDETTEVVAGKEWRPVAGEYCPKAIIEQDQHSIGVVDLSALDEAASYVEMMDPPPDAEVEDDPEMFEWYDSIGQSTTFMSTITPGHIVGYDTPLEEILRRFAQQRAPYYLVQSQARITHYIDEHSLARPPVLLALFAKVLELEEAIDAALLYASEPHKHVARLQPKTLRALRRTALRWRYIRRGRPPEHSGEGHDPYCRHLLQCATLSQKWNMLRREKTLWPRSLDFLSPSAAGSVFTKACALRNLIAHQQPIRLLTKADSTSTSSKTSPQQHGRNEFPVHSLYDLITSINQLAESLWRAVPGGIPRPR